jgi:hypothetical protein
MSTFYVLPARTALAQRFASYVAGVVPGLDCNGAARDVVTDLLAAAAAGRPDVYLVYQDELPLGERVDRALADGYGAEPGDEVVEVRVDGEPDWVTSRRWRLGNAA